MSEPGVRFAVHVKPRSSRSRVEGLRDDGALVVALQSPPVDGAANAELLEVLSRALGVRKAALSIVTGGSGRRKVLEVAGLTRAELEQRLESRG